MHFNKRCIAIILLAALVLTLAACGKYENHVFGSADPENRSTSLFIAASTSDIVEGRLTGRETAMELFSELSAVKAQPANDWATYMIQWPVYVLSCGTEDGGSFYAVWSNGYLRMTDGSVYSFNYDFSKLTETYFANVVWEPRNYIQMGWTRLLGLENSGWNSSTLIPCEELIPREDISFEYACLTDNVVEMVFRNDNTADILYDGWPVLQVQLDGSWYRVPYRSDVDVSHTAELGCIMTGKTVTEKLYLNPDGAYGKLPAGDYRAVMFGYSFEFAIP